MLPPDAPNLASGVALQARLLRARGGRSACSLLAVVLLVVSNLCGASAPQPVHPENCEVGAYKAADGESVALMEWEQGWVYLFLDGRYGLATSARSPLRCMGTSVEVTGAEGETARWAQVPLRMTRTRFESGGEKLYGLLVEPAQADAQTPLIVFVHGSGSDASANGSNHLSFNLPAQGISTFVYDKRGTGESEGEFTMDLDALAADLAAASVEARRIANGRHGSFGMYGQSQGSWVAAIAQQLVASDFLAIGYGMAYGPLEEDAEEVVATLREKDYSEDDLRKARGVVAAIHQLLKSDFTEGLDRLEGVKQELGRETWFADIEGEVAGRVLREPSKTLREPGAAQKFGSHGLDWNFDPVPLIRGTSVPQLWIFAEQDRVTVPGLSIERMSEFQRSGLPVDIALFPDTDHGILEFVQAEDGSRKSTRHAEGFYRLLADWINGRLATPYGSSKLYLNRIRGCDCNPVK